MTRFVCLSVNPFQGSKVFVRGIAGEIKRFSVRARFGGVKLFALDAVFVFNLSGGNVRFLRGLG